MISLPMRPLNGQAALVFGAGSIGPGWGNGKAISVTLARAGAHVWCVDRNFAAARETTALISEEGNEATALQADATRSSEVQDVISRALDVSGRIDILVNNIGIVETGGVVDADEESWDRVFKVNLSTCFLAMKHTIPHMVAHGGGTIINVSSIASLRYAGVPYASYAASKAAMNHLTRVTAAEYAPHAVRVNAVLPGLIKSPMVAHSASLSDAYANGDHDEMWRQRDAQVPMGYMGEAWDVANAALFLALPSSRYVTGIELPVDGGITLKCA